MKVKIKINYSFLIILGFFGQLLVSPIHPIDAKTNKNYNKSKSKISNINAKQEFVFLGCPGQEEDFEEISNILTSAQKTWNNHNAEDLIKFYAPDFKSKDGFDMKKIKENLSTFWLEYKDAKIQSNPASIQVCGDYATITLNEFTSATGQGENAKNIGAAPKFLSWVQGITTLKKVGNTWKISSEEILSEQMWKYYGEKAGNLLKTGKIRLIIPGYIEENDNYIAQLKYDLPSGTKGEAILDKVLLTDFPDSETSKAKDAKSEAEIMAIRRPVEGNGSEETTISPGLRRLFTANNLGQDELVRAQIIISSDQKGESPSFIALSQRVIPKFHPKEENSKNKITNASLKDDKNENKNLEK